MDVLGLVTIVGNLAIALSVVVAVVFGIAQARAAAQDRKERLAIEIVRSFQTREFAEHLHFLRITKAPATMAELYGLPDKDQVTFIQFAQEFEMLGFLVAEGRVDLELVERTLGDFVSRSWAKYGAVIADMRKELGDPYLAEYFQWLAERIERFMREQPRTPAMASTT